LKERSDAVDPVDGATFHRRRLAIRCAVVGEFKCPT
jgi:hypothetical protein